MTKYETIDYKELKKIMKLSIAIGVELGFYISYTQCYIEIDKYENRCAAYKKMYIFDVEEMSNIIRLVHAYVKLHKRKLSVW